MLYLVCFLSTIVFSLFWLWVFYLAWTHLERAEAEDKLSNTVMWLAMPVKTVGLSYDSLVNITVCSLLSLDLPQEALVSTRLTRYMKGPDGWRKDISQWVCAHLLDPFDLNGDHCNIKSKTNCYSTDLADVVNDE